jgi:putative SOS response-associated peptidase YedK
VLGGNDKQPWRFCLKTGKPFGFAALWAGSGAGATCAIITTSANELVAPVHERMPVVLRPDDEAAWLDADETDPSAVLGLLLPYPADAMEAYPVSPLVNDGRHDGPELIKRVG